MAGNGAEMGNVMRIDDSHGHVTSKDYAALLDLMQIQPVICIVDYSRGGAPGEKPCRDIASTMYSDYPSYAVSARGINYVHAFNEDEFIRHCSAINLEWLVPTKGDLPLGEQKLPVLVGRMKDTRNVTIQCDGRFVEIPADWVRDVALAMVVVASESDVRRDA